MRGQAHLECWGDNSDLQIGIGPATPNPQTVPIGIGAASNPIALSLGEGHTCSLNFSNELLCWGRNFSGQVGVGNTNSPVDMPTLVQSNVNQVARGGAGVSHVCTLSTNNRVYCWGNNSSGQLGIDPLTSTFVTSPTEVTGF